MISFPHCKINLGLRVLARRTDGFHDLETAFYPVRWCDALEAVTSDNTVPFELNCSGLPIPTGGENILKKAWELVSTVCALPPLKVHLYKVVPTGAGLGGGSADASFFLRMLRDHFGADLSDDRMRSLALQLGSDCPFFLEGKPVLGYGRGEILMPADINLDDYYIVIVHPGIHISTAEAFKMIKPASHTTSLRDISWSDPFSWRGQLINDFEEVAFQMHPRLSLIRDNLYEAGALYASMSGSGSAFYGIFMDKPAVNFPEGYQVFVQEPASKIL